MARLAWTRQGKTHFANPENGLQYMVYGAPKAGKGTVYTVSIYETVNGKTVARGDFADHATINAAKIAAQHDYDARNTNPIAPKSRQNRAKNPVGSSHKVVITEQGGEFYALIVRVDRDGQENVIHGFRGFYKTRKNAESAAARYAAKHGINLVNARLKNPVGGTLEVLRRGKNAAVIMGQGFAAIRKGAPFWLAPDGTAKSINGREPLFASHSDAVRMKAAFMEGRKGNPVPEGKISKLRKATKLYEDFRDKPGTELLELDQPDFSTGLVIGRLTAVEYDTVRGTRREDYRHKFKNHASPLLCVTSDGKTLFTVKGNFQFTERGICDAGE